MKYCVDVLRVEVCPLYDEIRYNHEYHYFKSYADAERFRKECYRSGIKATKVIDLENIPF